MEDFFNFKLMLNKQDKEFVDNNPNILENITYTFAMDNNIKPDGVISSVKDIIIDLIVRIFNFNNSQINLLYIQEKDVDVNITSNDIHIDGVSIKINFNKIQRFVEFEYNIPKFTTSQESLIIDSNGVMFTKFILSSIFEYIFEYIQLIKKTLISTAMIIHNKKEYKVNFNQIYETMVVKYTLPELDALNALYMDIGGFYLETDTRYDINGVINVRVKNINIPNHLIDYPHPILLPVSFNFLHSDYVNELTDYIINLERKSRGLDDVQYDDINFIKKQYNLFI